MNSLAATDIRHRSDSPVDWASFARDLDANGFAIMPKLLSRAECRSVSDTYSEGADECPLLVAKRTVTNRLPISIYEYTA